MLHLACAVLISGMCMAPPVLDDAGLAAQPPVAQTAEPVALAQADRGARRVAAFWFILPAR